MNPRHDTVVYSREPRGPGVELGTLKETGGAARDATFGEALTPLSLRLLASLHRRFNVRRLSIAALREAPPGCGTNGAALDAGPRDAGPPPDELTRNAPALSIRGEPVWAELFEFVLSVCKAPRPNRGRFVAPVAEPACDCERRLWIDVFAAAEEALGLRSGSVCFVTFSDSRSTANHSTPESLK